MDKNGSEPSDEKKIISDAIEIKIKTMFCRQTPTLRIDKRIGVGALKEEVTLVTGVLAENQRLIFRGKALRDDKLLSDYHVEDGDTVHLIVITVPTPTTITQMVSALVLSLGNDWAPVPHSPSAAQVGPSAAQVGNTGSSSSSSSSSTSSSSSSSSMDQPYVSLGNSAQLPMPMPNATAADPAPPAPGNSIEETNDAAAAEDTSEDDGGSPDVV